MADTRENGCVRILFVLPYGPTETRVRSRNILERIAESHDVTLLALAWDTADERALRAWSEKGHDVVVVPHPKSRQVLGVLGHPRRPLQQMVTTSREFAHRARNLIDQARDDGAPFDAVHVEHFRGAAALDLEKGLDVRVIYDAVDCLADLAHLTRLHNPSRLVRLVARYEEGPTRLAERRVLNGADVITVVSERDRLGLAGYGSDANLLTVPNGTNLRSGPVQITRDPHIVFTGKLSYHANQAAVHHLLNDIWPHIHSDMPSARLFIAGADPPKWLMEQNWPSVFVVPDPPDMLTMIERARVAVVPMVYSVGIQNKILEAMACGVPVVATRSAADGLINPSGPHIVLADEPKRFARAVQDLLLDSQRATTVGRAGHEYVRLHHSWETVASIYEALYAGEIVKGEQVA